MMADTCKRVFLFCMQSRIPFNECRNIHAGRDKPSFGTEETDMCTMLDSHVNCYPPARGDSSVSCHAMQPADWADADYFFEAPIGLVPPSLTSLSLHISQPEEFSLQHLHLNLFAGIINGVDSPSPSFVSR
ncbi:uncharacterized [Tachysurus ichikawai]